MQLDDPKQNIRKQQIDSKMKHIYSIEATQHCSNDRFKPLCLPITELDEVVIVIYKHDQREFFKEELEVLQSSVNRSLRLSSVLHKLVIWDSWSYGTHNTC